ncbi:MAG TPA: hypothetical protein VNL71_16410 [Chloroflexota bacterium]|nr:hypothetical protein [Chloroflexota bacterium]
MREPRPGLGPYLRQVFAGIAWDRTSTRLGVALLLVSALFFAANFADKAWTSFNVSHQRQQTIEQISAINAQIDQLKQDMVNLQAGSYYLQAARAYGFVRPGDQQIEVVRNTLPSTISTAGGAVAALPSTSAKSESPLRRVLQAIVPGL